MLITIKCSIGVTLIIAILYRCETWWNINLSKMSEHGIMVIKLLLGVDLYGQRHSQTC